MGNSKIKLKKPICPNCKSNLIKRDDLWTDAKNKNVVVVQHTCLNCLKEFTGKLITSSNGFKYWEQDNPFLMYAPGTLTQAMNRVRPHIDYVKHEIKVLEKVDAMFDEYANKTGEFTRVEDIQAKIKEKITKLKLGTKENDTREIKQN